MPCVNACRNEVGWDALASLENAFVPITSLARPGLMQKTGSTRAAPLPSIR